MGFQFKSAFLGFALITLGWSSFALGQTVTRSPMPASKQQGSGQQAAEHSGPEQPADPPASGSISGTVVDQSGAVVAGARVKLTTTNQALNQQVLNREVLSGDNGEFSFTQIAPGPFQLTIASKGFATQTSSGTLRPGETALVPKIALSVASNVTDVQVGVAWAEVAEEQIKVEEKQRILGAIPNFYVSYIPNAVPLSPKQKFELAWKSVIDPFTFVVVGGAAGVEQAQNHFIGYGQGAQGYAKRFGAGYADTVTGTFIGGAILPALLKQDPRYFYKGTGSTPSRISYAISMSVICKGDNRRWQVNYSGILGALAAGGISNLYYPAQDSGAQLTFENAGIGIASTAVTNILQEFVIRKFSTKVPNHDSAKP